MNGCNSWLFLYAVAILSGVKLTQVTASSFTVNDTTPSYIEVSSKLFSEKLVNEWGTNGVINAQQLGLILERLGIDETGEENAESNNCTAESVLRTHGIDSQEISPDQLGELCPSILYSAALGRCAFPELLEKVGESEGNETDTGPTPAQVWGYGFLFVTIINLGALAGIWVVPIMNKKVYKMVLMYLICLAVGTLCGNALLSLIPEAHGMVLETEGTIFIWKNLTVVGGIYLFFLVERILKIFALLRTNNKKSSTRPKHTFHTTAMHDEQPYKHHNGVKITDPNSTLALTDSYHKDKEDNSTEQPHSEIVTDIEFQNQPLSTTNPHSQTNGHNHSHGYEEGESLIASVAYMIIFGDALHNFIDGLAIGAAFSHAIYAGVSISIAVICEEFPHELGDFAILLNSGMSVKNAVLANVGSSLTCYLGLVIGIVLGELTSAGEWIFALAGGMFLYISLVDMLPEINNLASEDEKEGKPPTLRKLLKDFLLQNLGLLSGFALMLILALYAGKIQI